jgi:hypothetical protein
VLGEMQHRSTDRYRSPDDDSEHHGSSRPFPKPVRACLERRRVRDAASDEPHTQDRASEDQQHDAAVRFSIGTMHHMRRVENQHTSEVMPSLGFSPADSRPEGTPALRAVGAGTGGTVGLGLGRLDVSLLQESLNYFTGDILFLRFLRCFFLVDFDPRSLPGRPVTGDQGP